MARSIISASVAFLLFAGGAGATSGCVSDPLDDYEGIERRAEVDGSTSAVARGEIVRMLSPRLFQISNDELFPDRLWVLSLADQDVEIGQRVTVQGTLYARAHEGLEAAPLYEGSGEMPAEVDLELRDDPLLVVNALSVYAARMHG